MSNKDILKNKLKKLNNTQFIRYLIKTDWCFRDVLEVDIDNNWSESDINSEINFLNKL